MHKFGSRCFNLPGFVSAVRIALCCLLGGFASAAFAQAPANDNFASAELLTGDYGTVTADNTLATDEPGEPSHAGSNPRRTLWYRWTASTDAPVAFDTFNSSFPTVLGVYTGTNVASLNMLVANAAIHPSNPRNGNGPTPTAQVGAGILPGLGHNTPYNRPSGVKFNAQRGTTYYIAVGSRSQNELGTVTLSWAYISSGVFRFSSDYYYYAETEIGPGDNNGGPKGSGGPSARGARITVTRLFGSTGKVVATFSLADGPATTLGGLVIAREARLGQDYRYPGSVTLVFDHNEMSKSFLIPLRDDGFLSNPPGGRFGVPDFNRTFTVTLDSVVLDPLEDGTVLAPPRIEALHGNTYVTILDMDAIPGDQDLMFTNMVVNFERMTFRVVEDGVAPGQTNLIRVPVYRVGAGEARETHYNIDSTSAPGSNTRFNYFDLQAGADYASPNTTDGPPSLNPDFDLPPVAQGDGAVVGYNQGGFGTISFGQNDAGPHFIEIPVFNDNLPEFNEDIEIFLFAIGGHGSDLIPGNVSDITIQILYDDYPPGALDDTHNRDWDISTPDVQRNPMPGANGIVYSLSVQPDSRTVIAGKFSAFNAVPRYGIARLNQDGTLDHSFLSREGDGIPVTDRNHNYFISTVTPLPGGKFIVGGNFPSYGGVTRYNVAQIKNDGSLDTSVSPGIGSVAPNGTVWATAVQPDGKVLIAGDFTAVGPYYRSHVARLNTNGTVDLTFDLGTNALNGTVYALAVNTNGSIFIGGTFTSVGSVPRSRIALLETNGVVSTRFIPIVGADGPIHALAIQPNDGKLLIGGSFENVELRSRANIARYNPDGTLDLDFDPGTGTDDTVYSIVLQPDGRIFIGGLFTKYNQTRRIAVARLFSTGELDTGFMDTAYNQFAGPHKPYFNPYVNSKDFLFTMGLQNDGNLMIGGSFHYVGGGRFTTLVATNSIGGVNGNFDDIGYSRAAYRSRANVARLLGGDVGGPGGPGSMGIVFTNYSIGEELSFIFTKLVRANGNLGEIEATFSIPPRLGNNTNGIAEPSLDYFYDNSNPKYISSWLATGPPRGGDARSLSDGTFGTNNISMNSYGSTYGGLGNDDVYVTIFNLPGFQGDRSAPYKLDLPSYADVFYLGGENVPLGAALAPTTRSTLWIREDDVTPGILQFSSPTYTVDENAGYADIWITRTNGTVGQVQVVFATTNGVDNAADGTIGAVAGLDYVGVTNTITFLDGITNYLVKVPIYNRNVSGPDTTVLLYLANPGNGAVLGPQSNAVLTIINDNFLPGHINLASTTYTANEDAGLVTFTVTRTGGNVGTLDITYATSNLTAVAGPIGNYAETVGTLHWDSLDTTPRTVAIPLRHDGLVTGDKQFQITLLNPSVPGSLGPRSQAVVTLVNVDAYGQLQFSAPTYNVSEDGGYATITVIRTGGSAETVSASINTADLTAFQFLNYLPVTTNLAFGPGVVSRSFRVPILNDGAKGPASMFGFNVRLSNPSPAGAIGAPNLTFVNIIDAQTYDHPPGQIDSEFNPLAGFNDDVYSLVLQPDPLAPGLPRILAGGNFTTANGLPVNRLTRLYSDGSLDFTFLTATLGGANDAVRVILNQTDNRILVGGGFTTMNHVVRNYLARLNYDGSLDTTFNPGSAADAQVYALAETFDHTGARKLLVGGAFNTFNGALRGGIARLNDDGTLDPAYNQGSGANGPVYAIVVYPTNSIFAGQAVIAGDFTAVNGIARNRIARLNLDGSLDTNFDPHGGFTNTVRALVLQPDGSVLAGGSFTSVDGRPYRCLVRLNVDGSIDETFIPAPGFNDTVYAMGLQPDNRIVVVGQFTLASGVTRNRITRLLSDGHVDPSINFGVGANNYIDTVAIQPDGKYVIGGGFTEVAGQTRHHIARLHGGAAVGSGSFTFNSANYQADETSTNLLVTVLRTGGTAGPNPDGSGTNYVDLVLTDGTAVSGVNYVNPGVVRLAFPAGETSASFRVELLNDQQIGPDLTVNLALANPTPPSTLGAQPIATVTILNIDCAVQFASPHFVRAENAVDQAATIEVLRSGSTRNIATVDFVTTTNGTAVPGVHYTPVTNVVTFMPGQTSQFVTIPIIPTPGVVEGDRTVILELSNPTDALLLEPVLATLTIQEVDTAPGMVFFSQTNYFVGEGDGYALISVLRTNGRTGPISVDFATVAGDATPNLKYISTNGTLSFAEGELSQVFTVPILPENEVQGHQSLWLVLTNATGGAGILGPNIVPLTIIDDDVGISFTTNTAVNATYIVSETNSQVTLNLYLLNTTNGPFSVTYETVNGTALAGVNFEYDKRTLTFRPGENHKTISVMIKRDPHVTGDLTFGVNLTNQSPGVKLASPSTATVVINDVDTGISLLTTNSPPIENPSLFVLENSNSVLVTVVRTNASTGTVRVHFATEDGTASILNQDYTPTNGFLVFTNGQMTNFFRVPILDNPRVDGDRYFMVSLDSVTPAPPGQLLTPTNATVYILDNDSGLSFSSSTYEVIKGNAAVITVRRIGATNTAAMVNFATVVGGTASTTTDYTPTNGMLIFQPGQETASFTVSATDNTLLQGDRTVLLSLSSPSPAGSTTLVSPSAATLTIHDKNGSLVIPAGTALLSESFTPKDGVIQPGETVTMLFAFRNAGGSNTANLVATLLATNGISSPDPAGPQPYGSLVTNGPAVFRPFRFTASGTNGQRVVATFQLTDSGHTVGTNSGLALFTFTLGTHTASFTNLAMITINDATGTAPSAASPYPSSINVSNVDGVISKVTLSLNGVRHPAPSDIDALLVSPVGQSVLFMANAGGGNAINKVNLTFDDAASATLPQGGQIVSGTNKPSAFLPVAPFPAPAPPPSSAGYSNQLAAFNGSNPNNAWLLYIMDDQFQDSGVVSNGWRLNFTLVNPVAGAADLGVYMATNGAPTVLLSNIVYTLTVTNYGPGLATNVVVTDALPAGTRYVSANAPAGTTTATNGAGLFTWKIPSLQTNATSSLTLVVQAVAAGFVTNTVSVASDSPDLNPDDDQDSSVVTVLAPNADLAMLLNVTPNPALLGQEVTYTMVITNIGPGTAVDVIAANELPAGVTFIDAFPPDYFFSGNVVTFNNLGSLGYGETITAWVKVWLPVFEATLNDRATCASAITDPRKLNNSATVKSIVGAIPLAFSRSGNDLFLSWPAEPGTYKLETATDVVAGPWVEVTTGVVINNGQKTIVIPIGPGNAYFRLSAPMPMLIP